MHAYWDNQHFIFPCIQFWYMFPHIFLIYVIPTHPFAPPCCAGFTRCHYVLLEQLFLRSLFCTTLFPFFFRLQPSFTMVQWPAKLRAWFELGLILQTRKVAPPGVAGFKTGDRYVASKQTGLCKGAGQSLAKNKTDMGKLKVTCLWFQPEARTCRRSLKPVHNVV